LATLSSIDLRIADRLKNREFRKHWFRAALESDVPEQFRDLREARGMTQSDLAESAAMKQSAISRFEVRREASWKLETLLKLADALDAKLSITVTPAEEVIEKCEREEARLGAPQKSVLDRPPAASFNRLPEVDTIASKFNMPLPLLNELGRTQSLASRIYSDFPLRQGATNTTLRSAK
jgi:transcriptional regulator with XRE-family HTH domain